MTGDQRQAEGRLVRDALQALADANGGTITPDQVVETARDPDHPLHDLFEWNDEKAGDKWRREQARRLIRSVTLVYRTTKKEVRTVAYVRNPERDTREQGYISVNRARTDEEMSREVIITYFKRAAELFNKAQALAEVLQLDTEVADIRQRIDRLYKLAKKGETSGLRQ